jgi:23S rRNA pseudouridine1911/1915/1917 synthase
MREFTLTAENPEERLDRFLAKEHPELTRSSFQRLIQEGRVLVNGRATRPSYFPLPGDVISVRLPEEGPLLPQAEDMPVQIVYEDDCLLVINKPAGQVVHPSPGHRGGTLVNALLAHRPDIVRADLDPQRPGIVHRLDRDTSGLLLVAAQRTAQVALQAQFKAHTVEKTYLALLHGHLAPATGAIEAALGRDPQARTRVRVVATGGRYARSTYSVCEVIGGYTLVEAHPLTGRTHQLRVHLASIGHPVVGDRVYGYRRDPQTLPRQFLHAWKLSFTHPITGDRMTFTAELPADLAAVLASLREQYPE